MGLMHPLDEVLDLLRTPASGGISDYPSSFFLDLKVSICEEMHDRWYQPMVDDLLNLRSVACRDVGDGPATLLPDALLRVGQERIQRGQHSTLKHRLSLLVVAGDDIA